MTHLLKKGTNLLTQLSRSKFVVIYSTTLIPLINAKYTCSLHPINDFYGDRAQQPIFTFHDILGLQLVNFKYQDFSDQNVCQNYINTDSLLYSSYCDVACIALQSCAPTCTFVDSLNLDYPHWRGISLEIARHCNSSDAEFIFDQMLKRADLTPDFNYFNALYGEATACVKPVIITHGADQATYPKHISFFISFLFITNIFINYIFGFVNRFNVSVQLFNWLGWQDNFRHRLLFGFQYTLFFAFSFLFSYYFYNF